MSIVILLVALVFAFMSRRKGEVVRSSDPAPYGDIVLVLILVAVLVAALMEK